MKPRKRRATHFPVGVMVAQILLVVALVLVYGALEQMSSVDRQSSELSALQDQLAQKETQLAEREHALNDQTALMEEQRQSLEAARTDLSEKQAELGVRETALEESQDTLDEKAEALAQREQALSEAEASLDKRVKAVDAREAGAADVQLIRAKIAGKIGSALEATDIGATVLEDGTVLLSTDALFSDKSSALSKRGEALMDVLLPVYYGAMEGEEIASLSIEIEAASVRSDDVNLAGERAAAALAYARACETLSETGRALYLETGLSGARVASGDTPRVILRFLT